MRLNLQVTYTSGNAKEVTATFADAVAFEDKFDIPLAKIGSDPKLSYLLYLAWHSEKRTKATDLSYEAWLETVEDIGDGATDPK